MDTWYCSGFLGGRQVLLLYFYDLHFIQHFFRVKYNSVCVGTPIFHRKTVPEILPLLSCFTSPLMLLPEGAGSGLSTLMSEWDLLGILCAHQMVHQMCTLCL